MENTIFTSHIHMENENIINFYVKGKIEFTIPYLEDALEFYELTINELQEKFNDDAFLEDFTQEFYIYITKYEHIMYENHHKLIKKEVE